MRPAVPGSRLSFRLDGQRGVPSQSVPSPLPPLGLASWRGRGRVQHFQHFSLGLKRRARPTVRRCVNWAHRRTAGGGGLLDLLSDEEGRQPVHYRILIYLSRPNITRHSSVEHCNTERAAERGLTVWVIRPPALVREVDGILQRWPQCLHLRQATAYAAVALGSVCT